MTLIRLRDLGNTVIVVEHDENTILAADHVLDIGLGAGTHGGEVIYSGIPKNLLKDKSSSNGAILIRKKTNPRFQKIEKTIMPPS